MATRLRIEIVTNLSIEQLQEAVHLWDAEMSGPEEAIAPENVTPWDAVMMSAAGDLSFVDVASVTDWVDGFPDLRRALNEAGGDMHRAFDGVVVNEWEPLT